MELSVWNLVFVKLIFIYSHIYYLIGIRCLAALGSNLRFVICDFLNSFIIHFIILGRLKKF